MPDPIYCKLCGRKLVEVIVTLGYDEFTGKVIEMKRRGCQYCERNVRRTNWLDEKV